MPSRADGGRILLASLDDHDNIDDRDLKESPVRMAETRVLDDGNMRKTCVD